MHLIVQIQKETIQSVQIYLPNSNFYFVDLVILLQKIIINSVRKKIAAIMTAIFSVLLSYKCAFCYGYFIALATIS